MSAIPAKNVQAIKLRDGDRCARCSRQASATHHRMRRRDGHHDVANLIRLCFDCHSWVHAHPANAREVGMILPALRKPPLNPEQVPVQYVDGWFLLGVDGTRIRLPESVALARLERFGMREAA